MWEGFKFALLESFFSLAHEEIKFAGGCVFGNLFVPFVAIERGNPFDEFKSLAHGQFAHCPLNFLNRAHSR